MNIERIDYASRARERLEGALRRVGPDPAAPDPSHQRRAIAQQAFLMTRKAVEKSQAQPVAEHRQAIVDEARSREIEKSKDRDDARQDRRAEKRHRSGLDIVV